LKKFKITLLSGVLSKQHTFSLFSSVEALYLSTFEDHIDEIAIDLCTFYDNEYVEVEWCGCEFSIEGNEYFRYDLVRMIRARPSQNGADLILSIHYGWSMDIFHEYSKHLQIKRYENETDGFDFEDVFNDIQTIDDLIPSTVNWSLN
jgi:hypothetical protein